MLKIYNTLSRKKEVFVPINAPEVNMYACGITVSGDAHIGHLYQALIYDIIRNVLKRNGFNVKYARNYTDIDDKIIAKANQLGIDSKVYAQTMIDKIDKEMRFFQVGEPDIWLKATENVDNIIQFITGLIEKGYAYPTKNGDVYFSVENFPKYGCLSNRNLKDAQNGYRIDNDEEKESPLDFALWKSAKPGEPFWQSPWGEGRPGWHIECSAMNKCAFGEQIDIHGGGRDLVFPHHENEIAQSEALTGKPFAKYWIHNGLIKINGQKMSKSLGNTIILQDLMKKHHPETVKFALLQNSYRSDLNLTDEFFAQAEQHIYNFHKVLSQVEEKFEITNQTTEEYEKQVDEAMNDDFNTPKALSYIFEIIKTMQKKINAGDNSVVADYNGIKRAYKVLGIFVNPSKEVLTFVENKQSKEIPEEIKALAEQRWQAKLSKDWATADTLRAQLDEKGYIIKDSKDGYDILAK